MESVPLTAEANPELRPEAWLRWIDRQAFFAVLDDIARDCLRELRAGGLDGIAAWQARWHLPDEWARIVAVRTLRAHAAGPAEGFDVPAPPPHYGHHPGVTATSERLKRLLAWYRSDDDPHVMTIYDLRPDGRSADLDPLWWFMKPSHPPGWRQELRRHLGLPDLEDGETEDLVQTERSRQEIEAWRPHRESWAVARARIMETLGERVDRWRDQVEASEHASGMTSKRPKEAATRHHWEWLIRHLIITPPVTVYRLAKDAGVAEKTVRDGIRDAAARIGYDLPCRDTGE